MTVIIEIIVGVRFLMIKYMFLSVSGQLPPEESCSPVRIRVWVEVRAGFKVGYNQTIAAKENSPPVTVIFRVSFGIGGQFFSGAIFLEPFLRNHFHAIKM